MPRLLARADEMSKSVVDISTGRQILKNKKRRCRSSLAGESLAVSRICGRISICKGFTLHLQCHSVLKSNGLIVKFTLCVRVCARVYARVLACVCVCV